MPVEIRELVIRTVVASARAEEDDEAAPGMARGSASLSDQDAVVQECARQVLRILRKERER